MIIPPDAQIGFAYQYVMLGDCEQPCEHPVCRWVTKSPLLVILVEVPIYPHDIAGAITERTELITNAIRKLAASGKLVVNNHNTVLEQCSFTA